METDRRIVIVGAGGRLGAALMRQCARDFKVVGFNHAQLDLGAPEIDLTLEPHDSDSTVLVSNDNR